MSAVPISGISLSPSVTEKEKMRSGLLYNASGTDINNPGIIVNNQHAPNASRAWAIQFITLRLLARHSVIILLHGVDLANEGMSFFVWFYSETTK